MKCKECGHDKDDHTEDNQGRTKLPCEFQDCDCVDFIGEETCEECDGSGWVYDPSDGGTMVCPDCDGDGTV